MTREQVSRLDGKEGAAAAAETKDGKAGDQGDFLMPPACVSRLVSLLLRVWCRGTRLLTWTGRRRTAIANTLVTAWATGKLFNQGPGGTNTSKM